MTKRDMNARVLAPVLCITGFRFSKDYRRGVSIFHRAVYLLVNTVAANLEAELRRTQKALKKAPA